MNPVDINNDFDSGDVEVRTTICESFNVISELIRKTMPNF